MLPVTYAVWNVNSYHGLQALKFIAIDVFLVSVNNNVEIINFMWKFDYIVELMMMKKNMFFLRGRGTFSCSQNCTR